MKTRKNIYFKVVALAAIAIAFAMPAKAQLSDNGYANIDWQFNVPLSNNFADKASGWGMNFEGGYFVTPNLGLGLFLNYHSNHEYIPRETFKIGAGDVTTDQQHTMFQLPFGAAARYQWNRGGAVQPYVRNIFLVKHSNWVQVTLLPISNTLCSSCLSVPLPATSGIVVDLYNLMSVLN